MSERIHNALKVTRVEQFFRFFDSVSAARNRRRLCKNIHLARGV